MTTNLPSHERIEDDDHGRPFGDLRTTGVLWLVNRALFHPRGFALALHYAGHADDGAACTGWSLAGDGAEPWRYAPGLDEDQAFHAVEALLHRHRL